jgi:ABC-type molybdate transport system substrate-binding protein
MPKETRLSEDAVIYQPREEQSEKEKLRDMPPGKRLSYLWEYYRVHALIAVGVIALTTYIIHSIATPDIKTQFYAAMINSTIDSEVLTGYQADFADYLQIDPETESIEFNSSFYFNDSNEYSMNMKQVLSTYVAAQEIDVIIAPESEFANYAYYGYMDKLSDQLPTDVYSSLTDNFYISDLEEDKQKSVYGVYLTDTKLFKENANNEDPYILGIIANSKHKANTVEFIRFLFNE